MHPPNDKLGLCVNVPDLLSSTSAMCLCVCVGSSAPDENLHTAAVTRCLWQSDGIMLQASEAEPCLCPEASRCRRPSLSVRWHDSMWQHRNTAEGPRTSLSCRADAATVRLRARGIIAFEEMQNHRSLFFKYIIIIIHSRRDLTNASCNVSWCLYKTVWFVKQADPSNMLVRRFYN